MKRQSDLVQATALAYAEREVLEASMRAMSEACPCPSYCFLYICLTFELCSGHRLYYAFLYEIHHDNGLGEISKVVKEYL
jgi:hypothetical protein